MYGIAVTLKAGAVKNQIDVYRFAKIVVEVFGMHILIFSAARSNEILYVTAQSIIRLS